jgi:hypothetical protein
MSKIVYTKNGYRLDGLFVEEEKVCQFMIKKEIN